MGQDTLLRGSLTAKFPGTGVMEFGQAGSWPPGDAAGDGHYVRSRYAGGD